MSSTNGARPPGEDRPAFYTVPEAARILRVNRATVYRAIQENAFPAVRIRTRFVVPAQAVDELARRAAERGEVVDVAGIAAERRQAREFRRATGGGSW
jgi:excisionase family DNA binding protein